MSRLEVRRPSLRLREADENIRYSIVRSLAPTREVALRTVNNYRSAILLAPMNRGKTSWMEAMLGHVVRWLVMYEGVDEREIAYVYSEGMDITKTVQAIGQGLDLGRITYLFIFSDDAPAAEGQHGRRAMSVSNVAVSQFYTRIRHNLRRHYGYERAITTIHSTQVYTLIDKTFRETADLDVLKALPKNQADIRQIETLIKPEYVGPAFSFLSWLGKRRLLAKNVREYLQAIYTALVVIEGEPIIVPAYRNPDNIEAEVEEARRWLSKAQQARVVVEDVQVGDGQEIISTRELERMTKMTVNFLNRILEHAKIVGKGSSFELRFERNTKIYITKEKAKTLTRIGVDFKGKTKKTKANASQGS